MEQYMEQYIKDIIKDELERNRDNTTIDKLQKQIEEMRIGMEEMRKQIEEMNIVHKGEKFYQKQLEKILGGGHVRTKHGITDVTTDDAIYEIKEWKKYKACFGQLKSYSIGNENKRLCAAFYGQIKPERRSEIVELFTSNNMEVYEVTDAAEMNRLDKLNKFDCEMEMEMNHNLFYLSRKAEA